jgi:hypothetical protein
MTPPRFPVRFETVARVAELADWTSAFTIRAACTLGIADRLADGPRSLEELAAATETHPPSLLRLMHALVGDGVFAEPTAERFALTELGDVLRTDHVLSLGRAFRLFPDLEALGLLDYSVRTGRPAVEHLHGEAYWDYLAAHPELRAAFDATQGALTRLEAVTALRAYEWSSLRTVVDVGGNDGAFLAKLLARNGAMRGVVFDLPESVSAAPAVLAEVGVADRCEVVAGSIFDVAPPARADAYVLKRVLIGMSDHEVIAVLRALRAAMGPRSRLLILEPMGGDGGFTAADMDVLMLVLGSGRVRTAERFGELLAEADLRTSATVPTGLLTLVESRPVDRSEVASPARAPERMVPSG